MITNYKKKIKTSLAFFQFVNGSVTKFPKDLLPTAPLLANKIQCLQKTSLLISE
jgi:hypothetical protein